MTPDIYMPWALIAFSAVFVPSTAFLVGKTLTNDQKLKTHEATDALRFVEITRQLTELKAGQGEADKKLDELVDRMPRRRK